MTRRARPPLTTTRFGVLRPDAASVLTLVGGLVGFPGQRRFLLLDHAGRGDFGWLQSADDGSLAFPVTDPRRHLPDCRYVFGPADLAGLRLGSRALPDVLVTVSVTPDGGVRLNLSGPLVFNFRRRLGRQLVQSPVGDPIPVTLPCSFSPVEKAKAS
ncbi:MAG: flagellar assembly protein FliW [Elusimicrobia bacterium]|nr:flagellar assembly protein FliW [Elusimicrobiota bacterium]